MEKLGGNLLNFEAKHQIFKFKWKFLSQDSFFVTHSLRKSFSMSLNWLTNLRPLLIALVEVLQVLDLDPVLQRGEVKVGQGVHRPRVRGLRLVVHGGQAATAPTRPPAAAASSPLRPSSSVSSMLHSLFSKNATRMNI